MAFCSHNLWKALLVIRPALLYWYDIILIFALIFCRFSSNNNKITYLKKTSDWITVLFFKEQGVTDSSFSSKNDLFRSGASPLVQVISKITLKSLLFQLFHTSVFFCRDGWGWSRGCVNRLQQCHFRGCCRSSVIHTGELDCIGFV